MFETRKAGMDEIPLIRGLCYQVWPQTYEAILSPAQIDYMLDLFYSERSLANQMREGQHFFILYRDGHPKGFASVGEIEPVVYKLHKIYVLFSEQGKGAGRYLVDEMVKWVAAAGARALQLNVNRYNKARSFYEKLGFKIIREEDIDIGHGFFMNDYVMEKAVQTPAANEEARSF
jgi:GNAT superfamily N-acetyltransferase